MVKLEEIVTMDSDWESDDNAAASLNDEDDDAESTTSESSLSSDDTVMDESLWERITALKDIVPPETRLGIRQRVHGVVQRGKTVYGWASTAAWVLSTTALMVAVPLAVQMEREVAQRQWEQEMKQQQQQEGGGGGGGGGMGGSMPPPGTMMPGYGGLAPPTLSPSGIPAGF